MQVNPPTGRIITDAEMRATLAASQPGFVTVQGSSQDVATLSRAVRMYGDLTSAERARRRNARKVARASRRANRSHR